MEFDWVTVAAQVVNFLILVFLLKRFLYNPVIRVMDRREQRISDRLERARSREEEAESLAEDYEQAQQALAAQRDRQLEAARQEAETTRQRLIDEARSEVAARRRQWREALSSEQERVEHALHRQVVESVTDIARQVLDDLAAQSLEDRILERFIARLEADGDVSQDDLASWMKRAACLCAVASKSARRPGHGCPRRSKTGWVGRRSFASRPMTRSSAGSPSRGRASGSAGPSTVTWTGSTGSSAICWSG